MAERYGSKGFFRRILRAQLIVAAIGVVALVAGLGAVMIQNEKVEALATRSAPVVQAANRLGSGVQHAYAALRGWVSLPHIEFSTEWRATWVTEIDPAMEELKRLRGHLEESHDAARLDELVPLLRELEESQWWVRDVAHAPGNEPARMVFSTEIEPLVRSLDAALKAEADQGERRFTGNLDRARIALFEVSALLERMLVTGEPHLDADIRLRLGSAAGLLREVAARQSSPEGTFRFKAMQRDLAAIEVLAEDVVERRRQPSWNLAQHLMTTESMPLAERVHDITTALVASVEARMASDARDAAAVARAATVGGAGVFLVMVAVVLLVSWREATSLARPVGELSTAVRRFADGDLSGDIPVHGEGEVSDLIRNVNTMRASLEEAIGDLRRSNDELKRFAYVASHDLQEPLRSITNFLQLLQYRYADKLDDKADEYINFAVGGAKRMRTLIHDLLEFSRVERQGEPFVAVDLGQVTEAGLGNLKTALEETDARIEVGPLPTVSAAPSQIQRLMENLISNAVKFRAPDRRPEVAVSAEEKGDRWEIRVRDNGIGIAPDYSEKIFIIFQRLHGVDVYPGTGIGLAVCKKIVELHGGRIWVESEETAGSTFHFTLPKS